MDDIIDTNPYAAIPLPLDLGSGRTLTALRPASQFPEAVDGDPATGWITVPAGTSLSEVVFDSPGQRACTLRLALDLSGDIAAQINERIP
jgi:hypothetical protein